MVAIGVEHFGVPVVICDSPWLIVAEMSDKIDSAFAFDGWGVCGGGGGDDYCEAEKRFWGGLG